MPAPVVIALGGNAIIRAGEQGTIPQQFEHTYETMVHVAALAQAGVEGILVTHGNGPQMGNIMLRNELAQAQLPQLPMSTCVADLQGGMGYMIQQSLRTALVEVGILREVATVITQVEVDPGDKGFRRPTKPIGHFMSEEEARAAERERGWLVGEDAGRGWRRLVASPAPIRVIEEGAIRALLDAGAIVIAAGGGGVPVVALGPGRFQGVDAVIDKDLASAELAIAVGAREMLILTGVDNVMLGFDSPYPRPLGCVEAPALREHVEHGEFAEGSMLPKVLASLRFIEGGGDRVVITSPDRCVEGYRGKAGTQIIAPGTVRA